MSDFPCDYASLAAADRAAAANSQLENVRHKHLKSAESWDRLADEEARSEEPNYLASNPDERLGERKWTAKTPS